MTLIITIIVFALFFLLISARILLKKGGEFRGTCASQSPFLNKETTCGFCGKQVTPESGCANPEDEISQTS